MNLKHLLFTINIVFCFRKTSATYKTQEYNDLFVEILSTVGERPNLVHFYGACLDNMASPVIL